MVSRWGWICLPTIIALVALSGIGQAECTDCGFLEDASEPRINLTEDAGVSAAESTLSFGKYQIGATSFSDTGNEGLRNESTGQALPDSGNFAGFGAIHPQADGTEADNIFATDPQSTITFAYDNNDPGDGNFVFTFQDCSTNFHVTTTSESFPVGHNYTVWFTYEESGSDATVTLNVNSSEEEVSNTFTAQACFSDQPDVIIGDDAESDTVIYEVRTWHTIPPSEDLNALADPSSSEFNHQLEGQEHTAYMLESGVDVLSAETVTADLSKTFTDQRSLGVRTNWSVDLSDNDRFLLAAATLDQPTPAGEDKTGKIHFLNDDLTNINTFDSCNGLDQETPGPSLENSIGITYDSFVVQSCEENPSLTNYDQTDGQIGIMQISTCDQTDLNTPYPQTLNNILVGDSSCAHQVDMVPEDDIRRNLAGFSSIKVNHGSLPNATNFIVTGQVDTTNNGFKVFNGSLADSPIIDNDNTQAREVVVWNDTVWVQEPLIAAGGNFTLNRWDLFQNSTGDWQSGSSPNKSVELQFQTESFRASKDGRFLIQVRTQDSVVIRNGTTLEVIAKVFPNLEQGIDADLGPCNNFLYVLSNNGADQTDLERFSVADKLEGPGGSGNPNPCPDGSNTQATNTTIGDVEDDPLEGEPSGDGPQSGDPGLLGDTTLQATADSLGINLTGVRIFYAGLLISGLALAAVVFTRANTLGASAGQAAMAGALGGSVISLGLGLLPIWFFVLIGILGIAVIVIRR